MCTSVVLEAHFNILVSQQNDFSKKSYVDDIVIPMSVKPTAGHNERLSDPQLTRFLVKHRDASTSTYTHGSQISPEGKFHISGQDLDAFYKLYSDRLMELGDDFISGLAEKASKWMPVLVDIDIKVQYDPEEWDEKSLSTHIYKQKHVDGLIAIYQSVLKSILGNNPNDPLHEHHLICVVLEKSQPYLKNKTWVKNGFHLHFPYIYLTNSDQEVHLVPRIKEQMNASKLFQDLSFVELSSDLLDGDTFHKNWLMYGSRKEAGLEPYKVTRIVGPQMEELSLEEVLEVNPLLTSNYEEVPIDPDVELAYYLPYLLSVRLNGKKQYHVKLERGQRNLLLDKFHRADNSNLQYEKQTMPELVHTCKKLVPMLSPKRASDYGMWGAVGLCLNKILNGSREGLDMFLQFSQKCPEKYDEAICIYEWTRFSISHELGMGHLRGWAKRDSPEEYNLFREETQAKRINDSLQGGQTDLAKYLYDRYNGEFVCASIKDNLWYHFHNHRWQITENGNNLYKLIDKDLVVKISNEISVAGSTVKGAAQANANSIDMDDTKHEESGDPNAQNYATLASLRIKELQKVLNKLKTVNYKEQLIKECRSLFYQEDFLERIDSNPKLIGFRNGILDLSINDFRAGRPEDYVSFSCGYDFKFFTNDDDPYLQEVFMFFRKVLVDESVRDCFFDYCAKLLESGQDQRFFILSGVGANGKSMTIELLHATLGDYCTTVPTTLLTGKSTQSSQATPELVKCMKKKFVYTTEPEGDAVLNCGQVKKITGDGKIDARGLFRGNIDLEVTFKLALLTNNLPKLPPNDDGIWRRIFRIPFTSWFPEDDREVPEHWEDQVRKRIFPRDNGFQKRIPELRQAMVWLMWQRYMEMQRRTHKVRLPDIITSAKEEYRLQNDEYALFIRENLVLDPAGVIQLTDFIADFTQWCKDNYDRCKYKPPEIKTELLRRWGNDSFVTVGGPSRFNGWRKRNITDELAEGTNVILDQTNAN